MVAYELDIRVERPPVEVFAFFAHMERMPEWAPGIVEQRVDGGGPVELGTTGTEVRRIAGRTATSRWEITGFERPRSFTMGFTTGGVSGEGRFRFEPEGAGTRVRVAAEARGGLILRLGAPLFRRAFVREDRKILEAAKHELESS